MEKVVQLQRKIAPEFIALMEERYHILRHIGYAQPVGRRALAAVLGRGERIVRAQVDFLKSAGLIDFSALGMTITEEGQTTLSDLAEYIRLLHGLTRLEVELAQRLNVKQMLIIPGDTDADFTVRRELGRAAAGVLSQRLGDNMTIAVSGGSTMAMLAGTISAPATGVTVVPARGGLGERVEYQANTIAAVMANRLGGRYHLIHIPDGVSEETLEAVLTQDANMRAVAEKIRSADILVYGIGNAAELAAQRGLDASAVADIVQRGGVGEALGHYCDLQGRVLYDTSSIGLRLDDLAGIGAVIAVAGGRNKAAAIVAVTGAGAPDVLIVDEGAAKEIQRLRN